MAFNFIVLVCDSVFFFNARGSISTDINLQPLITREIAFDSNKKLNNAAHVAIANSALIIIIVYGMKEANKVEIVIDKASGCVK